MRTPQFSTPRSSHSQKIYLAIIPAQSSPGMFMGIVSGLFGARVLVCLSAVPIPVNFLV